MLNPNLGDSAITEATIAVDALSRES